ncbi:TPA: hypothetical protein DCR49_08120 [Candidatus Delongbacteria bacterium]|nr:MAG: hypothetical protein A2Y39_05170 [Candidatus Delongbacteria bacterium GWF2_40_14]HAQ61947.1 hypothetical protein [Candidatus Delongbacteria bacterium]
MKGKVLIVEDKHSDIFEIPLKELGLDTKVCESFSQFKKINSNYDPDVIVLDLILKDGENGIDILKYIDETKAIDPEIIVVSGEASRSEIAEVMRFSPYEFYDKTDYNEEKFVMEVKNALKVRGQKKKIIELEENIISLRRENKNVMPFIGESKAVKKIRGQIEGIRNNDSDIFLVGRTGTGKEIVANNVHYLSDRFSEALVKINCSAIPESLIEKELFGSEKGSFTGSDKLYKGYFETAGKGTIFLDEIQTLDKNIQSKLLRVIENKEFYRVGQTAPLKLSARIIFGTNVEPEKLVFDGIMREDFFYRLDSCMRIDLPPVREREDDILILLDYFIKQENSECTNGIKLDYDLGVIRQELLSYPWNGNVREIRNFSKRLVINSNYRTITNNEILDLLLRKNIICTPKRVDELCILNDLFNIQVFREAVEEFEKMYLAHRLKVNNNNKFQAAQEMQYDRTALYKKLKKLDMENFL